MPAAAVHERGEVWMPFGTPIMMSCVFHFFVSVCHCPKSAFIVPSLLIELTLCQQILKWNILNMVNIELLPDEASSPIPAYAQTSANV